jgi:hypothetical protein
MLPADKGLRMNAVVSVNLLMLFVGIAVAVVSGVFAHYLLVRTKLTALEGWQIAFAKEWAEYKASIAERLKEMMPRESSNQRFGDLDRHVAELAGAMKDLARAFSNWQWRNGGREEAHPRRPSEREEK